MKEIKALFMRTPSISVINFMCRTEYLFKKPQSKKGGTFFVAANYRILYAQDNHGGEWGRLFLP